MPRQMSKQSGCGIHDRRKMNIQKNCGDPQLYAFHEFCLASDAAGVTSTGRVRPGCLSVKHPFTHRGQPGSFRHRSSLPMSLSCRRTTVGSPAANVSELTLPLACTCRTSLTNRDDVARSSSDENFCQGIAFKLNRCGHSIYLALAPERGAFRVRRPKRAYSIEAARTQAGGNTVTWRDGRGMQRG